jgi:hypothetical protein
MKKLSLFKKKTVLATFVSVLSLGTVSGQNLTTLNFSYTGGVQTFVVPALCINQVTVQVWGAEGGGLPTAGNIYSGNGGKGGYSYGVLTVAPGNVLNVYVGGIGASADTGPAAGGFNGGGQGYGSGNTEPGNGGGGASDIRLNGTGLNNRVIVAGGGGGGGEDAGDPVGNGGGLNGIGYAPYDASQTAPGVGLGAGLGVGATTNLGDGGGGGGGYYGGGSIDGLGSVGNDTQGGGGGSGYIGGVSNGISIDGLTSMPDPNGGTTIGRSGNGFVRIIYDNTSPLTVSASPSVICVGQSAVLNVAGATFTWQVNGSSAPSINVSPNVTTTYSVSGVGSGTNSCFGTATIQVKVNPLPILSAVVSPTLLCVGKSATLTANGAVTYTWNGGPTGAQLNASPGTTTTYMLAGTSQFGCVNTAPVQVLVNTNSLTVPSNISVCQGTSLNLLATGAVSYTWISSNGNAFSNFSPVPVSPNASTSYTVSGTDANGCVLTSPVAVTVNSKPAITASASKTNVCQYEAVNLMATGSATFSWQGMAGNIGTGSSISVSLPVNVMYSYTVTGTDSNTGCSTTSIVTVSVDKCVGINETSGNNPGLSVYPNPAGNTLNIALSNGIHKSVQVMDLSGRVVVSDSSNEDKLTINLSTLANGIYYVKVQSGEGVNVVKIVKSN